MTESTRDLLRRVLQLPPAERALLVREVRASLDDEGDEIESDPAFTAELERRIRDLDEGRVKPVPFDELLAEGRRRLDAMRGLRSNPD